MMVTLQTTVIPDCRVRRIIRMSCIILWGFFMGPNLMNTEPKIEPSHAFLFLE